MAWDIAFTAGLDDKAFKEGLSRMQSESSKSAQRVAQSIDSQVGGYRKLAAQITGTVGAVTSLVGVAGLIAGAVWGAVEAGKAFYDALNRSAKEAEAFRKTLDGTLRSIAQGEDVPLQTLLDQMAEANDRVESLKRQLRERNGARSPGSRYSPDDEFAVDAGMENYFAALRKQLEEAERLQLRAKENLERKQRAVERQFEEESFREKMKHSDDLFKHYIDLIRKRADEERRAAQQLADHWKRVFEDRNDRLYRRAMEWVDYIIAQRNGEPVGTSRSSFSTFSSGLATAPRLIGQAIGNGPSAAQLAAAQAAARREAAMQRIDENLRRIRDGLEKPIMLEVGS